MARKPRMAGVMEKDKERKSPKRASANREKERFEKVMEEVGRRAVLS